MANYTGWTCIHCGQEVDGPVNDHVCEVVVEEDSSEVWVNPNAPKPRHERHFLDLPRPFRHMGERPRR